MTIENYDGSTPIPEEPVKETSLRMLNLRLPYSDGEPVGERAAIQLGNLVSKRAEALAGFNDSNLAGRVATRNKEAEDAFLTRRNDRDQPMLSKHGFARYAATLAISRNVLDDTSLKDNRVLSDAYREALSEVRPLGGEIEGHKGASRPSMNLINKASQYFPSEWIEASNEGLRRRAKKTSSRAHYVTGKYDKVLKTPSRYYTRIRDPRLPHQNQIYTSRYEVVDP